MKKWPDGISIYINATPEDGFEAYDVWHNGGPGGPMLTTFSLEFAESICAAIDELLELRKKVALINQEKNDEEQIASNSKIDE